MALNSQEAQRLVDVVAQAKDRESAVAAAETAFSFLVAQLHLLSESANGYPRNPIQGNVWKEGHTLATVCDRFADAVARWGVRSGEEQATRLAVSMALQVMAHYPEEIFPRVLRNAKCCESLEKATDAAEGYRCIVGDFESLDLEVLLEPTEPLEGSGVTIVTCVRDALAGLERLAPQDLTEARVALRARVDAALDTPS